MMDRDQIVEALTALGRRLAAKDLTGELYIVGGAALALAYAERRSTRDIDAVFEPKMAIYEAAAEVAVEFDLPEGWLPTRSKDSSCRIRIRSRYSRS